MQAICLITLMFVNGAYLFISFNMESMIPDNEPEQVAEVIILSSSSTSAEFDPADILDLDILDFAVDELDREEDRHADRTELVHDRV
jgi:hypothetical protein